jgi:hypothetical protein
MTGSEDGRDYQRSLVVYGGSAAGVMAAVQAARLGDDVALVEPGGHIGGMSVEGLGSSDIDNHASFRNSSAVGGLAIEFYQRIGRRYGRDEPVWKFESHVAEQVFKEMLQEADVTVCRGASLREGDGGVTKRGERLVTLNTSDGRSFHGDVFIDATIEGDLLHAAGVSTIIGRESNATYGETLNGIRGDNPYRQFEVRVDPYVVPGRPESGVIQTIQDEPLGTPGEGDHRVQAYCFRLCLTDDEDNRVPFSEPPDYDPDRYEIYRRYVEAGGQLWRPKIKLPNRKTDLGSWHDLSGNLYGMNHAYPGGDHATRQRVLRDHLSFTQGLCWFLCHDQALPNDLRREWSRWGVCRDEFVDHAGWPRMFYVRDARRMVSDYVITEHHTKGQRSVAVDDPVALAYWPPDTHHVRRIVRDGAAYNEGFVFGGNDWGPFGIAQRALTPRADECVNLITPTCPSSSHVAYGAIRLEWTFMMLGQAAAIIAHEALSRHVDVQAVPYASLRERLLQAGVKLEPREL